MKKFVKLGLFIITMFFGVNIIKAERTCEDIELYANRDFWGRTGINMNYAGTSYNYSMYTLKSDIGAAFSSYCRNAGASTGKKSNGEKYYCKEVVFDTSSSNETKKIYDAGVIEILKQGYSSRNNNTYPLEKNQEYAATTLALRVYEMLWKDINTNGSNNTKINNAHKYYVNLFLDDSEITSKLREASGSVREKFSNAVTVTSWTTVNNGINVTNNIVEEARRLVKLGLDAAVVYKNNGAATLTWNSTPVKAKSPVVTDASGNSNYRESLTYTFKADKFRSSNGYIRMNFSCTDCATYGIDYTLYVNDTNVGKTIPENLISLLTNGAGEIKIKIEFTGDSAKYKCDELNYELKVTYYDETINTEAYDMYSEHCYSNVFCQHFYMLYADDVAQEATIKNSTELCSLNCDDLKRQCEEDNNADACSRFQSEYGGTCANCSAYISNAQCSDTDSVIDIKEGYEVDSSTCNVESEANVLGCIINKEDQAGNSYKATDLVSNKYCSIWCKEDYHFVMPGIKEVNSGRYFSLKTSVQGTKTCYTSKINKTSFENDYESARKEIINNYNTYKVYEGAVNESTCTETNHSGESIKITNRVPQTVTETTYSCPEGYTKINTGENTKCRKNLYNECYKKATDAGIPPQEARATCSKDYPVANRYEFTEPIKETNNVTEYQNVTKTIQAPDYTDYKCTWSYSGYTSNGGVSYTYSSGNTNCSGGTCTYESKGSTVCTGKDNCTSTNGTPLSSVYNSTELTSKKSLLNSAISSASTILKNYNSCSTWTMDYDFKPDVHFWYEESYMNNVYTDKLDTVGNTDKSNVEIQRCTSDTNNSYESCTSGWSNNTTQYKDVNKFICYKNSNGSYSCGTKTISVSQTIRMKASVTAKGEYVTPTQFYTIYPTGAIAVSDPNVNIENGSPLTNRLPVGLGTTQGVYNYTLIVNNLGEYYNSDKLGRVWGAKDSVVSETLKENSQCQQTGALKYETNIDGTYFDNGVYVCAYKVNCPDCPVECEENGCYNPDCPDGNCPVECKNCIYNNNNSNINYRPITPGDLNPNDRDLGKNWQHDNSISTALEMKAYVTTEEIEENGENIYDINYESTDVNDDFAMEVVMDSKMISKIRAYNEQHEDDGGYLNNSLKCYDHENSEDGKTYKNIYCYSTFIDELLTDNDTKDNIKITGGTRYLTEAERKAKSQWSGYWTTWSEANLNKWTITTEHGLAYYKENYAEIGIGPAWK